MFCQRKVSPWSKSLLTGFFVILVGIFSATAQIVPDANGIIYVKQGGTGDGSSWTTAMGNLQNAIDAAGVRQVWVAKGTYSPNVSFYMKRGVAIYGGFPDNNNNVDMADRNWATHRSVLRGYSSCVVDNDGNALTPTDILDGFTITNGFARVGGGIYNATSSPSYVNLIISGNTSRNGGGICILGENSAPHLTNVLIRGNTAQYGGGVWNGLSSPLLTNVTISGNSASQLYSASEWYNYSGTAVIRNSIMYGNSGGSGGAIVAVGGYFYDIQNSLVQNQEGNSTYEETGNNNLPTNTAALFTDPAAGIYTLQSLSPAVNKGKNTFFDSLNADSKDLNGNSRLIGSAIDMGAFESPDGPLPVRLISFEGRLNDQQRAVLTWKTDEINASHYEIEQSSNAKDFHLAGTITAGGNGSVNYIFTDPAPVSGNGYYRIRMVDRDDTFSYSRMISLAAEGLRELFAYPNPARDRIAIELGTAYIGSKVKLFSTTGTVLQEKEVKEKTTTLDISRHTSGIYLLQLHDGSVVKLIKE